MDLTIEEVTPEAAAELLAANGSRNRQVNKSRVAAYAADMSRGSWSETGDPIKLDSTGQLIDGQHRLLAIVKSELAMMMAVARGVEPEAMLAIDTGRGRSLKDLLHIQGYEKPGTLATLVNEAAAYEIYMADKVKADGSGIVNRSSQISEHTPTKRRSWTLSNLNLTRALQIDVLGRRPSLVASAAGVQSTCGARKSTSVVPPTGAVGVMFDVARHGYGGASVIEYVEAVRAGIGILGSASNSLHSVLERHHSRPGERLTPAVLRSVWFRGYLSWLEDVPIKSLRKNHTLFYPTIPGDDIWYKEGQNT